MKKSVIKRRKRVVPIPREDSPSGHMQMEGFQNDGSFPSSQQNTVMRESSNTSSRASPYNYAPLPIDFTSYGSRSVSREQNQSDDAILLPDTRKRSISEITSGDDDEPNGNQTHHFSPAETPGYHQYPPPSQHQQQRQDQDVQRSQYPSPINTTTSLQQQSTLSLSNPRASRFNSISALLNTEPHRDMSQINFGQEDRFLLTPNANHILPSKSRSATPSSSLAGHVSHSDVLDPTVSGSMVDSSNLQPGQDVSIEERRSQLKQDTERMKERLRAKEKELEALEFIG